MTYEQNDIDNAKRLAVRRLQNVTPDARYQVEPGKYKPDSASRKVVKFLELQADSFEALGLPKSELGHHPGDRLIGSDRKLICEILRRLADTMDPIHDDARRRAKHHQERIHGLPTIQDIRDIFPETLLATLDQEIDWDKDLELAHLDEIASAKWGVSSNSVKGLITARHAMGDAWENLDIEAPNTGTGNLADRAAELREFWAENCASAQEMAKLLINDENWIVENAENIDKIHRQVMSKPASGGGLLHDITWTD